MPFIFICCVIPFGFTQQTRVNLTIDQDEVEVDSPIMITVTTNVKGEISIDFPMNFKTLPGTQSGSNKQVDLQSGKSKIVYFSALTGAFQSAGKYTFQATVKTSKKAYKSNSVTVRVQKKPESTVNLSGKATKKPVFGTVETQKKTVYEGESVLINAKIYTKYDLSVQSFEAIQFTGYPDIKPLKSNNELNFSPVNIKNQIYYQAPFEKKLLFFSAPGTYEVGPYKMGVVYETDLDYINYDIQSNKEKIEVLPLPANAPTDFINGVGDFKFSRNFDFTEVKQGDVVVMTINIEGEGNVQNITKPHFDLPDGVIQYGDPEVSDNINYQSNGAVGSKTYRFHLQFLEKGNYTIPKMELSYFDPKQKKYIILTSKEVEIEVLKSNQFENQVFDKSEGVKNQSSIANQSRDHKQNNVTLILLGVFIPASLGLFLFLFLKRKPNKELEIVSEIEENNEELIQIESHLFDSKRLQVKGDFKASYQELESAIRKMLVCLSEKTGDMTDSEASIQQLSNLRVACESARYMQVYQQDELINVQNKTCLLFDSLKSKMK